MNFGICEHCGLKPSWILIQLHIKLKTKAKQKLGTVTNKADLDPALAAAQRNKECSRMGMNWRWWEPEQKCTNHQDSQRSDCQLGPDSTRPSEPHVWEI
jgi:hypothetical protein